MGRLRDINWQQFGVPALPDWLEGIASADEKLRRQSYDSLYDAHLDELTFASSYFVPFLIELLKANNTHERQSILLLLMQLASAAEISRQASNSISGSAIDTLNAIASGSELYLSFLSDQDLRLSAIELLRWLKINSHRIVPHLLSVLDDIDRDQKYLQAVINAIAELEDVDYTYPQLHKYLSESHAPDVRVTAATAIANLEGMQAPDIVDAILASFLRNMPVSNSWNSNVAERILKLGVDRAITILSAGLAGSAKENLVTATVARTLLLLAFDPEFPKRGYFESLGSMTITKGSVYEINFHDHFNQVIVVQADRLTLNQSRVLQSLINSEQFWQFKSNVLQLAGVPNTRAELAEFIDHNR